MDPEDLKCFPDVVTKPSTSVKELVSLRGDSLDIWIKIQLLCYFSFKKKDYELFIKHGFNEIKMIPSMPNEWFKSIEERIPFYLRVCFYWHSVLLLNII